MARATLWKVVWITGASSGIGWEMALQLAREGVTVAATGRSHDRLAALAALHPNIRVYPADVTDPAALAATVEKIEAETGPIDLAILNAGVWMPMGVRKFSTKAIAGAMDVNFQGIVNALEPLLPLMMARRRGHVALVASLAGHRGLPQAISYGPTKAAVINLAECLQFELPRHGVGVSIVNPGFVDTPMTKVNTFPMPFLVKPDDAAARIIRGLKRGQYHITFPWPMAFLTKLGRVVHDRVFFFITRTFGVMPLGGDND